MSLRPDRKSHDHWWARRTAFLRSVGLEIPFILRLGEPAGEKPKVIIKTSRKLAIVRCSIHVIPCMVSITVLILNIGNSYLGRGLPGSIIDPSINIALLQIAAKIQELLMVGSMTTIVMHVLRSELISGEGLPLGLLGGGFLYSSMSYFWSPEFWGSLSKERSWQSKARVYGIVVLGGFIALLSGPSTAVLLVPRDQKWPAGGTPTYIAASSRDWWPTTLSIDDSSNMDACRSSQAVYNATCPSGGFLSMLSAWPSIDILGTTTYVEHSVKNLTSGFTFGPRTLDVSSDVDIIPGMRYHGNHRGYACETSVSGPRLANAAYQARLKSDWIHEAFAIPYNFLQYGPSLSQYKYFGSMQISTDTQIPTVRTTCSSAQILNYTQGDVLFPVLDKDACWNTDSALSMVNIDGLSQTPTNKTNAVWVQLPTYLGSVSGGLILKLPTTLQTESEELRAVVTCSFDARWAPGHVTTYHLEQASSLEQAAAQIVTTTSRLSRAVPASGWAPGYSEFNPVASDTNSSRISFNASWLEALTPIVYDDTSSGIQRNMTTLERIIDQVGLIRELDGSPETNVVQWNADTMGKVNRTVALEWWLSIIIADGLSREGSSKVVALNDETSRWSLLNYQQLEHFRDRLFAGRNALAQPETHDVIEERSEITIEGYSYRATSITDYASATILLIHILVACIHTSYAIWTKRSSTSWDSLTELLVLMHKSRPAAKALVNTSAGIDDMRTFSKRARILAKQEQLSSDADDIVETAELMFEDDGNLERIGRNDDEVQAVSTAVDRTAFEAISMDDMSTLGDAASLQESLREPWTFPIGARNDGLRTTSNTHDRSKSTDRLIQPAQIISGALTEIQSDRFYG